MQLPDEALAYHYQSCLVSSSSAWTPAAELRARHFLEPTRLRALIPQVMQVRSQVAAERELRQVPPEAGPLEAGFIELPQTLLDSHRRQGEASELGKIMARTARFRAQVDRVVILGVGGSYLGPRALFGALRSAYHNEMLPDARRGVPRIYFEGNHLDNDALAEFTELLQTTCVDPETREERWGVVVVSKSGDTLETALAHRLLRREAAEYYGPHSGRLRELFVPVTGASGKLRDLCKADGFSDEEIFTIPENVSGRFSVFSAAGLLPAAVMGLDVRALLLGAAAMTRRFVEEPFERNPALQYAAVNHLMAADAGKPIRVLSIWSRKLEALGLWYDHLLAESLGKQGRGATPVTAVLPRDLHSRGQQHQEGARDKFINNMVVGAPQTAPVLVGMADRNEDDLNALARKKVPDLLDVALRGAQQAYADAARPTATLTVPPLAEHTMGQLMQMLMLATVVEGRLMGVNPYGQPGTDAWQQNMRAALRG